MLQKRLMKRTQTANNTLSGYIGSSTSDRSERSNDNQSVKSDGNNSETSDKKSGSGGSGGSNANTNKPMKNCPICKKAFTKATVLKKHIMSHSNAKPFKLSGLQRQLHGGRELVVGLFQQAFGSAMPAMVLAITHCSAS